MMKSSRHKLTYAGLLIILSAVSLNGSLVAQQDVTCVPYAAGPPWLPGAPNWWSGSAPPNFDTRLDDPRWLGAVGHTGSNQEVEFRAVHRPDSLFLSWIVHVDDGVQSGIYGDAVWFGIQQGTTEKALLFKFTPTGIPVVGAAQTSYGVDIFEGSDGTTPSTPMTLTLIRTTYSVTGIPTPPAWTTVTRKWVPTLGNAGVGAAWAFQTVVPISSLGLNQGVKLNTSQNFKMWYALYVILANTSQPNPVVYWWPDGMAQPVANPEGGGTYPALDKWGDFSFGPTTSGKCGGEITIATWDDIATGNTPNSHIQYTVPPSPLPTSPTRPLNDLYVRPTNTTLNPIPAGDLTARFWIANWGSQPDWNDIPNKADLWKEVTDPAAPPTHTVGIPASPTPTPDASRIRFPWTMSVCQWFNFLDPAVNPDADLTAWLMANPDPNCVVANRYRAFGHQCILAELSSTAHHTFLRKSYWQNMDLEEVHSTLTREAQISVRGLVAPTDGKATRTLYLLVQTLNMPARTGGGGRADGQGRRDTSLAAHRARVKGVSRESVYPTYRVHVYRETTDSVGIRGSKYPTLRPQNSFGYWVLHDGEIIGWTQKLAGARLERLAPNFYRITVPNDSFITVTSTIEAVEPKPFALSLHAGLSFPSGTFKNTYDHGVGVTGDLERRLNSRFTLAALFGYHRFDSSATTVSGPTPHLELYHFSGSLETTVMSNGWFAFIVDAGGGMYWFKPGTSKAGAHAGVGLEYAPSLSLALEISARAHNVFTSRSNTTFAAIQAGGRVMF